MDLSYEYNDFLSMSVKPDGDDSFVTKKNLNYLLEQNGHTPPSGIVGNEYCVVSEIKNHSSSLSVGLYKLIDGVEVKHVDRDGNEIFDNSYIRCCDLAVVDVINPNPNPGGGDKEYYVNISFKIPTATAGNKVDDDINPSPGTGSSTLNPVDSYTVDVKCSYNKPTGNNTEGYVVSYDTLDNYRTYKLKSSTSTVSFYLYNCGYDITCNCTNGNGNVNCTTESYNVQTTTSLGVVTTSKTMKCAKITINNITMSSSSDDAVTYTLSVYATAK